MPDGALLHALRVPLGYWEAKDEEDDLDKEIEKKFRKGYPQDNIIFEDFARSGPDPEQAGGDALRGRRPGALQNLLELSSATSAEEIADFRKAVEQFKTDLPAVLEALREMIETAERDNVTFRKAAVKFLSTRRKRSTRRSPRPTCARC